MSKLRQPAVFDPLPSGHARIDTHTRDYPPRHVIGLHFHDRDQLVYASRGVMTIRTEAGVWVVPTHRAVWIPASVPHTIAMSGTVAMRTLYLKPGLAVSMPRDCCVVNISPLLRELILHACTCGALYQRDLRERHLIEVILDQLVAIQRVPLRLPALSDPRALRVCLTLLANPASPHSLTHICRGSGASRRTMERLFQQECGMTFGKWRQQLRLMHSMQLLGAGAKVTHAALEAGYSTPSAFIAAFRKALGTTPTAYFAPSSADRTRR
ncbi:MAG TPA: helix-turn-helix transcriptional regulator [Acidobacteriaceae bacterium]|jgi:AraC-like DNA-binding protein|nr:helix-turn-helix transcriptional regulator [Acidobacteriaceae bacterium]